MTNTKYSQKEQEPPVLYRTVALNLFKQSKTGVLVDSVCKCLNALDNGSPHRLTKEFDDLIALSVYNTGPNWKTIW